MSEGAVAAGTPAETEGWRDAPPPAVAAPGADQGAAEKRDIAQRAGDLLMVPVGLAMRVPIGFILLIAGWGISVPAVVLRMKFFMPARVLIALAAFGVWVGLIVSQA